MRAAIEAELGVQVVSASSRPGGFSPGLASKLVAEDGREIFLKVVLASVNRESVGIHRREARIAAALPRVPEIPEFLWSLDDGQFVALAFEYVDGSTPPLPWLRTDLERVLGALERLSDALTPSPIEVETAADELAPALSRWQTADVAELARLPPAWRDRLDELVDLERRWPEAASGKSLLHLDVRADNVLLTPDRVHFVDWPWAAIGARWLDVVAMLPSVAMQGGPLPEDIWDAHPSARRRGRRRGRLLPRRIRRHAHDRRDAARSTGVADVARVPGRSGPARSRVAGPPSRLGRCGGDARAAPAVVAASVTRKSRAPSPSGSWACPAGVRATSSTSTRCFGTL